MASRWFSPAMWIPRKRKRDDLAQRSQLKKKVGKAPKITSGRSHADYESCHEDFFEDDDYAEFLRTSDVSDVDLGCADLQYESFLKDLREDGTSYILVVEEDIGDRILLKYEAQEGVACGGLHPHPNGRKLKNDQVSANNEFVATARNSKSLLRSKGTENLRERNTASKRKANEQAETLEKRATENTIKVPKESPRKSLKVPSTKRNVNVQDGNHASPRRNDGKRGPPQPLEVKNSKKRREESEEWDESYLVFMDYYIRSDGEILLHNHEAAKVRYHEDDEDEESSSSDVVILDSEEVNNEVNTPFVTSKPANCIDLEIDNLEISADSEFKTKLLEYLRMPYNAEECEKHSHDVAHRRHKEVVKQLRGGLEKLFVLEAVCESYLDQYQDFAAKLSAARGDQLRTLNLLRGFVFYINNIPMEGVFRPWMDQSCCSILAPLPPPVKQTPCLKVEPVNTVPPLRPPLVKRKPLVKEEPS